MKKAHSWAYLSLMNQLNNYLIINWCTQSTIFVVINYFLPFCLWTPDIWFRKIIWIERINAEFLLRIGTLRLFIQKSDNYRKMFHTAFFLSLLQVSKMSSLHAIEIDCGTLKPVSLKFITQIERIFSKW